MGRRKKKNKSETETESSISLPSLDLAPATKRGIAVVIFFVLAGIVLLAQFELAGSLGAGLLKVLTLLFGVVAYVVPLLLLFIGVMLLKYDLGADPANTPYARTYLGALLFFIGISGLIHLLFSSGGNAFVLAREGSGGGYFGAIFAGPLSAALGFWASALVLFAALLIGALVSLNVPLHLLLPKKAEQQPATAKPLGSPLSTTEVKINTMAEANFVSEKLETKDKKVSAPPVQKTDEPVVVKTEPEPAVPKLDSIVLEDRKDWKLPPFDLLDEGKSTVDSGNIEANVALIHKTLKDFGIEVEMGEVNVGPTVTQYTLRPAQGVKLSAIATLQNDLALALAAHSIRMELPIPGKSLVGIEVPNKTTAIVRLRDVLQTSEFINHPSKLAIALGRDVSGKPQIADLARMPHMLIAGATGTGKSVAINSLLISLLYRNTPQDAKFIVVDPKRVEMTLYNGIPHLLTPPITDPEKAVNAMKWAVAEMDRRYKLMAEVNKRSITEYNAVSSLPLPYIVILVDELADLMAVAQADIEAAIVRLAQMARAVGIHLVLATQSPRTDIITGLIKANITSRVAFAVGSQIESRIILDMAGAEKLLGNGDMLFISTESNKPRRVQGSYVGEKEVRKVVDFFKTQAGAVIYNEEIIEKPKKSMGIPGFEEGGEDDDDELFEQAKQEVLQAGKASASFLQRRLKIGYARAARLLDILEDRGIIGPGEGAKPREVYGVIPAGERAEYGQDTDEEQGY